MHSNNIYGLLKNDILFANHPDIYYINQENDINTINTHKKKGRRYCFDAYEIIKHGKTYTGSYSFDKKKDFYVYKNPIKFNSFSNNSGLDFCDFINSILNANPNIFVHVNGLEIYDLRKKIFLPKVLEIRDTYVDNLLLVLIKKYFSNLEEVEFINCTIKKECDFSKFKCNIKFDKSVIEDFRVFNDTEAELDFLRTKIVKITNTNVSSKTISFRCINEQFYEKLFLKCNFNNLENLKVYPEMNKYGISFKDQFKYLPRSAPNLENFCLEGKVSDFDFITDIKNILRCSINSIQNIHGSSFPDVDTNKKREELKKKNIEIYNVRKILNPDIEDKYLVGSLEQSRILSLARFNKLLNFTDEEYEFLKNNPNLIEYIKNIKIPNGEITKFYELYFNTLILRNTDNEKDVRLGLEKNYMFLDGFMYKYRTDLFMNSSSQKIVQAFPFMYSYDNKPIVFMNRKKEITTLKEASKFLEERPYKKGWDEEDLVKDDYEQAVELIKKLLYKDDVVTIGCLMDAINEMTVSNVNYNFLEKLGEGGRYIYGLIEAFYRSDDRYNALFKKNSYYRNLIEQLIIDNYEKFNIEEKKFLLEERGKYEVNGRFNSTSPCNLFLLKSVDLKTNGLYSRYFNMVKLTYNQTDMQDKAFGLVVKKEYIKKLDFSKM